MECARRELLEETGIHAEWLEELGRVRADGRNTVYCEFLCITDCKKDSIVLQEGETSDYRWVTRDELLSMKRDELVTQRMQMFIDELKSGIRSDADRGPYEPVSKEKMEFKKLTSSDTEWNALADYAENCSWGAGKTLAEEMRQKHFTGWERVILAEDQGRVCRLLYGLRNRLHSGCVLYALHRDAVCGGGVPGKASESEDDRFCVGISEGGRIFGGVPGQRS